MEYTANGLKYEADDIDRFRPQVQILLEAIAEVTGNTGIAGAFVTDLSSIDDFYDAKKGEDFQTSYKEFVSKIEEIIGVEINCQFTFDEEHQRYFAKGDYLLTAIARKMAEK